MEVSQFAVFEHSTSHIEKSGLLCVKVRSDFLDDLDQIDCDFSLYHAHGARRGGRRRGIRATPH
jgi:hypothetical protein